MKPDPDARLLRIFIGEFDKLGHQPLYEAIVFAARKQGLAGATVLKGIMSFGASSVVHTAKLIEIAADLPIVIEIVDTEDQVNAFVPVVSGLLEEAGRGGMITVEKAFVMYCKHRRDQQA